MSAVFGLLSAFGGLIVFAGAYYVHQKVRLTRIACIAAAIGGFMMYGTALGARLNEYALKAAIVSVVAVFVGICIIVADVKGKKKGADRPALFAFFLVPIFLVAFLVSAPAVVQKAGDGIQKVSSHMQTVK